MHRPTSRQTSARDAGGMRMPAWVVMLIAFLLGGCGSDGVQSALNPAGPAAREIEVLWWIMLVLASAVVVAVIVLLAMAVWRRESDGPPLGSWRFVLLTGLIIPTAILIVLLFYGLRTTVALQQPETALTIEVVGHQWWWEVRYPEQGITTANEIHIPAGQPVKLELSAADVIHSFWVPRLHGKMDLVPDHVNVFWMTAEEPGRYRGQCAEFCGVQHALMAFEVVALEPDEFEAWATERSGPAPEPETASQQRGLEVFLEACGHCHAVRGTPADARVGPDLTDLASRRMIGAGTVPNTRGHLAGWIADPQPVKPGNLMPPSYLPSEDLTALIDYLETLE